jgi:hypothetical protein
MEWEKEEEKEDHEQHSFIGFDAEMNQEEQKGAQKDEDMNPNNALIDDFEIGSGISEKNVGSPYHKSCQNHGPVIINEISEYSVRAGIDEPVGPEKFFGFHGDKYGHQQSMDRVKEREVKPSKASDHQDPNCYKHRSPGIELPAVRDVFAAEGSAPKVS